MMMKARWHYTLKWIPGGAPTEPQPDHPWWSTSISKEDIPEDEITPYSLLPLHLVPSPEIESAAPTNTNGHMQTTSEVDPRPGWYCRSCGKLNVQNCLCFQRCSKCQVR